MTTLANIDDVVPTKHIEKMILGAHRSTPIALQIAWGEGVAPGSGNNLVIPRRVGVTTNAGNKAENDEFALVNSTTDSESLSGGWVGHSDRVSWESNTHAVESSLQLVITDGVEAIVNRVDVDGLTLLAGASNSSDYSGLALTEERVLVAKAAYVAQRPHGGMHAFVMHTIQHRDWGLDLTANGGRHLGGDAESARVADMLNLRDGYVGVRHGLVLFSSMNVATAAGDATGAMCKMGVGGALAYRNWVPIGYESEWEQRRKAWMVTIAAYYGFAISDDANARAVVSRAT